VHRPAADEADPAGAASCSAPSAQVELVPIDRLRPDPANPRQISADELDALTRSIRRFGFVEPVIARRATRIVIAGHQRLVGARRLGMTTVPAIFLDVTEAEAQILGLALNRIGGSFDEALLARLLADLRQTPDVDVSLSGFGEDEIGALLRRLDAAEKRDRPEAFDLDAALEAATRESRTKPGDLWILGEHRLLCGDATQPDDVAGLLGGRHADLAVCDPPYNIDYRGGRGRSTRRRRPIANDDLDPAAFATFVGAWVRNLLAAVEGALYVFMSSKELPTVSLILAAEGGHWSDTIVWSKDRFTLGRAPYQRSYEPIWFGWREGSSHHWCGARDQSDVWEIARPAASPLHPTQKPLELLERAIEHSSRPDDLVLDLFGGSGSTLIAAERTGRRGAMLELDPVYCDVIVARWTAFAGGEPRRGPAEDPAEGVIVPSVGGV